MNDDIADLVSKALRHAWQLGQTYWQQADSEHASQWKRADATQDAFNRLVENTRAAVLSANSGAQPAPSMPDDIVREVLRDCCGTFHGSRHRITCEKYKGKRDQETSCEDE